MVSFAQSIEVSRPIKEVFDFLDNPVNYMLWQANVADIATTNGMRKDSVIHFIQTGMGKHLKLSAKVTANNGHDMIAASSNTGPITFTSTYQLRALGPEKTELTLNNQIDTGSIFSLAAPVLQHLAEVRYDADLKTLKAILEQGF